MKKIIRLIALDLDGTTFTDDKRITEHTQAVLEQAMAAGIHVLPCTGRQQSGLPESFLNLKGVRYAIVSNGAAILDLKTKETIYTNYIPYTDCADCLEDLLEKDILADVYIDGKAYVERRLTEQYETFLTPLQRDYFKKTRIPVDNLPQMIRDNQLDAEKIHNLFHDPELMWEQRNKYATDPRFYTTNSLVNNMELNAPTANKGNALLALADLLNIPHDQTMACGDGLNDLDMLREAGFSVAMANAAPEVKSISDYITKSNEEDGVAYAIETFVL